MSNDGPLTRRPNIHSFKTPNIRSARSDMNTEAWFQLAYV